MLKNKYIRIIVFAALVGIIYYDVHWFLSESQESKPSPPPATPIASPAVNPPAPQSLASPNPSESEGVPSAETSAGPPELERRRDFLQQLLDKEWGRDPFFTVQELDLMNNPSPAPVEVAQTEAAEEAPLELQMILISPTGKIALINSATYREGQSIAGGVVKEIRPDGVLLQTSRGPRELKLKQSPLRARRKVGITS